MTTTQSNPYINMFQSIPNAQWGVASWPNQNMSPLIPPSRIEQQIQSQVQQPDKPQVRTKQEFFDSYGKAVQSWDFWNTPKEEIYKWLLQSYKKKWITIEWVNIDKELGITQPQEQPKDQQNIWQQVASFWESIKPFTATDTKWMDTSTLLWSMKKSFYETVVDPLKSVANIPWDTIQLAWQVWDMILHPLDTAQSINDVGRSLTEWLLNKVTWSDTWTHAEYKAINEWVVWAIKNIAQNPEELKKMIVENPTDVMLAVQWGIWQAGKLAEAKWMTKLATSLNEMQQALNPINTMKGVWAIANKVVDTTVWNPIKAWINKWFGDLFKLNQDTIKTIIKDPQTVSKLESLWLDTAGRQIADNVVKAIENKSQEISDIWKGYSTIRATPWEFKIDVQPINKIFADKGFKFNKINKIDFKGTPLELDTASQKAIQQAYDFVRTKKKITAEQFLNARQALDTTIDYRSEAWNLAKSLVKELRMELDSQAKAKIPWLAKLDATYWPERELFNKVKSYIYNRDGSLKDNYIQTIGNITGKWKEIKLDTLEKISPDLAKQVNAYKALQDVEWAKWHKVWTYSNATYSAIASWIWFASWWWIAWGVLWPVLFNMMTHPTLWLKILKSIWVGKQFISSIWSKLANGIKITDGEIEAIKNALINKTWDALDKVAEKVGVKVNFIDNTKGTWISGKIEIPREVQWNLSIYNNESSFLDSISEKTRKEIWDSRLIEIFNQNKPKKTMKSTTNIVDNIYPKKIDALKATGKDWKNSTWDVTFWDTIKYKEAVYTPWISPKYLWERTNIAEIIKDSYWVDKQQHTFTIKILKSDWINPIDVGTKTTRKWRNIYKNWTQRLEWKDEELRKINLADKHQRWNEARSIRDIRKANNQ